MSINQFPFKVLFCFEDDLKVIAEVKRTDIQSEDKSLVYKWLLIDKNSRRVQQLSFIGMDQSEGEQIRVFGEGTLTWNAEKVSFNQESLVRIEPEHIPVEWLKLIAGFLV